MCHPRNVKSMSVYFVSNTHNYFLGVTDSQKGPTYAFCIKCNRDTSLSHGGIVRRCDRTSTNNMNLQSYFGSSRAMSVVEAEVKFGYMLGEHHLPFLLVDHCTKLFHSMFPDSTIAKDFKCGHTKATAILKVIAQDILQQIKELLKQFSYFSLQVDKSTDISVTSKWRSCCASLTIPWDV